MMQLDPVLDAPDTNEQWCVYETTCEVCEKRQIHVATVHAYTYGYVEPTPLCAECIAAVDRLQQSLRWLDEWGLA